MSPNNQYKKEKVLIALDLIRQNKGIKAAEAARITRVSYSRVLRRLKRVPRLLSQGGHNKKLDISSSETLKVYLLMCHALGKKAGIDNTV